MNIRSHRLVNFTGSALRGPVALMCVAIAIVFALALPNAARAEVLDLSAIGQDAQYPEIEQGPDGSRHLTWRRSDGSNSRVQYVRISAEGEPGPVSTISAAGQNANWAHLAVDSFGNAHIVWHRNDGSVNRVQYVKVEADGTVGAVITLDAGGQETNGAQVKVDSQNRLHIVWSRNNATNYIIQYVRIAADGTVGAIDDLSSVGQSAYNPKMAVGADDSVQIAWQRSDGSNDRIEHVRVAPDGVVGSVQQISPATSSGLSPEIAITDAGIAHVVWLQDESGRWTIRHALISADGTPGESIGLTDSSVSSLNPSIDIDSDGAAHIAWYTIGATESLARYVKVDETGVPGAVIDLSNAERDAFSAELRVDDLGFAHVVWQYADYIPASRPFAPNTYADLNSVIQYAVVSPGGTAATPATLSDEAQDAWAPELVVDPTDFQPRVTWHRWNGTEFIVQFVHAVALPGVTPTSHDFGVQVTSSGATTPRVVTVTNEVAAGLPVVVAAPSISGSGAAAFSVASNTCSSSLAPGASCEIGVVFDPTAAGAASAQLDLLVSGSDQAFSVALTGTGTDPVTNTTTTTTTDTNSNDEPDNTSDAIQCPAGTSKRVTCSKITTAVRRKYGCAAGEERGYLMVGTSGRETFVGTSKGDIIVARGGTDTIRSAKGADSIHAGDGADNAFGGAGEDCLRGDGGNDVLRGEGDDDVIRGHEGEDRVLAGAGNDKVYGGPGADTAFGGFGNDHLHGNEGPDQLFGEAGDDHLFGGIGPDIILLGGTGVDVLQWEID